MVVSFQLAFSGVNQPDILTFKIQPEGRDSLSLANGIVRQAFDPLYTQAREKRLVNHTAREKDKTAAIFHRGIDNFCITTVSVHPDQQVEILGHFDLEFGCDPRDDLIRANFYPLPAG